MESDQQKTKPKSYTLQVKACSYTRKETTKGHFENTWKYSLKSAPRKADDLKADIKISITTDVELNLEKDQFIDLAFGKNQKRLDEFNKDQLEKANKKNTQKQVKLVKKKKK